MFSGPFSGMRYVASSVGSSYEPKLLGTYELELSETLDDLIAMQFDTVVDVGAAEGYYAVGMAYANHACKVVAFESRENGRQLINEMAEINGVRSRVHINGFCDPDVLKKHLPSEERTLVIMDVEGAEVNLLDPSKIPALRNAYILVEIHDFVQAGLGEIVSNRFNTSHTIKDIPIRPRTLHDYPFPVSKFIASTFAKSLNEAIAEHRHENSRWFFMTPHNSLRMQATTNSHTLPHLHRH